MSLRPEILYPLFAPIASLKGVGTRLSSQLSKLAGHRVLDLLWHLPIQLMTRQLVDHITPSLHEQMVILKVKILAHAPSRGRSRAPHRVTCMLVDSPAQEKIELVFFHAKEPYLKQNLPMGETRVVSGKIEIYQNKAQIIHPDYIVKTDGVSQIPLEEAIYPSTQGLSRKKWQSMTAQLLDRIPDCDEWLDPHLIKREGWPKWRDALCQTHRPLRKNDLTLSAKARQRLAYDEVLARQLTLALSREAQKKPRGRPQKPSEKLVPAAIKMLPFALTSAQKAALQEMQNDMASPQRMIRLLQGDVGSGKTIICFLAALQAIENGYQGALMAPTDLLARQHAESLAPFCEKLGIRMTAFTGRDKGKKRDAIYEGLANGEIQLVIGTHALFQEAVSFQNLGLIIIDEQHRFGVEQRLALMRKGSNADVLVMSATPIPRTLEMANYGDMDISRIDEKPAERQPIQTVSMPLDKISEVTSGLARVMARGEKIYWVCPLIEESEVIDLAAAEDRFQELQKTYPGKVALIHGRIKPEERDQIMEDFQKGAIDILVATTVIEVGINVPNATVIIIEQAERFGLAQLHQLRGRVGRSHLPSHCLLLYKTPLSQSSKKRLQVMRESNDGFYIAEEDLRLRGSGEVLGKRQSGLPQYKLIDPEQDYDLFQNFVKMAHQEAALILNQDPYLQSERGQNLKTLLYLFEQDEAVQYLKAA